MSWTPLPGAVDADDQNSSISTVIRLSQHAWYEILARTSISSAQTQEVIEDDVTNISIAAIRLDPELPS